MRELIVLSDPLGNRIEIFHGAETATEPFKPGRAISGFRTGPLGMGHAVLHVNRHQRRSAVLSRRARLPAVGTICCVRSTPISSTPIPATTRSRSSKPAAMPTRRPQWRSCSAWTTSDSATTSR